MYLNTTTSEMLKQYLNPVPSEKAVFKNIPIAERENVLAYFRTAMCPIRIRYRGSRKNRINTSRWYRSTQSYCLRSEADRFSVYFGR